MSSNEVQDAVGMARNDQTESAIVLLSQKRRALEVARENYAKAKSARDEQAMSESMRLIDQLRVLLPELETEAAAEREAIGRENAGTRMLGIKKAFGSVLTQYREDDQRVEKARQVLVEAITQRNARARKLEALQTESSALADRFDLPKPKFENVSEPAAIELPRQWRTTATRPDIEETKDGTRRARRTFAEASGSVGYSIIQSAGLRPFRPLTPAEKDVLDEKENRQPDPVLAAAVIEANALGNLGVPGGGVARG